MPVNCFKWVENTYQFTDDFIKSYNEDSQRGYSLETFLPERMKTEKFEKLVTNLNDKEEYAMHTANLKQALNCGLGLKKVHRVIKFNQKA